MIAIFDEPTKDLNASSLHSTHVLVQDVDFLTPIKNQFRGQLFPHFTLCHERTQSNGLYDVKFCCYAIEIGYDRVFCIETEASIEYSASDER